MKKITGQTESQSIRRVIVFSGGAAILTGVLATAGWITGLHTLDSIHPDYIPMALPTAILSMGFGLVFFSGAYKAHLGIGRFVTIAMIGILSLYAFLKFIEYFLRTDLTLDPFFFPVTETFGKFPINRSSPITGLLFFLTGLAILIKLMGRERLIMLNLVSWLGVIVMFAGFTGLMGYLFRTPFLYGSDIIPLSLLTTITFLLLGCGIMAMGGTENMFLRRFSGNTAGAKMLRAILPIIVVALLADDFLDIAFSQIVPINRAIILAIVALFLIPLTVMLIIMISRIIFRKADEAEAELRQARDNLNNQNEFLHTIIESLSHPFYVIDPDDYTVLMGNSASGWSDKMNKATCHALAHGKNTACDGTDNACPVNMIRKTHKPVITEHIHFNLDGTPRTVEVHAYPVFDRDGNLSQVIEYSLDITERKKLEEALKESEKQYRLLVGNLGEGIVLVDPDEYFVFVNPATEQIFGVPPGGLTGRNLKEFLLPDQLSRVLMETGKRAQKEQSTYELDIITPDNQRRNLLVTATPQVSSEGAFTGTFGVLRDISERKKVDAELARFTKQLQDSNATKDKFFSIIAHDLKNPFNSILGLTNVLIDEYQKFDKNEIEHTLNTIKRSSEKAFELLENLLLWANSQTGQIIFNPQEFNLQTSLEEIIALLEVQAARKKIRIVIGCAADCLAFGDKQMVQTILRNLISNAIKFTPHGGEVVVSATRSDDHYEITVKDNGVGIAERDIPKLFKIESKYSTSGTAKEKGTGLGLILCKEFIEKHGGKIWVESEHGKGSRFIFTLPAT